MFSDKCRKYQAFPTLNLTDRSWPNRRIESPPQWCSVDLRDGNQALIEPLTVEQKLELFDLLINIGFKQIEVGFPAASTPDFEFVRRLIEEQRIPADVTIQVLTQSRNDLIEKTFVALAGVNSAIVHLYNSTSTVQRQHVFQKKPAEIIEIATSGAKKIMALSKLQKNTQWLFQYSPESFTGTELPFAVEICEAVCEVWQASEHSPVIINLPATVEMSTPNVYADQIEWFCRHFAYRAATIISVHTHNDRGTAVAASELAVMAGADRIEGTLLGNGERTGNMDIITMAMNLFSQGIDPKLNFSDMNQIISTLTRHTQIPVHPRHPYVGELVYSAFSGSHQDAIRKCLAKQQPDTIWQVAYLPIDPHDLGRNYQEVIRVNSQSGKGGVAYIMENNYGIKLPRWMQIPLSEKIQTIAEQTGAEVSPTKIWRVFEENFLKSEHEFLTNEVILQRTGDKEQVTVRVNTNNGLRTLTGEGKGALDAMCNAVSSTIGKPVSIVNYCEQAVSQGNTAQAICFIKICIDRQEIIAAALHEDILSASFNALLSSTSRFLQSSLQAA